MGEVGEQAAGLQDLDVVEAGIKRVQTVASLEPGATGMMVIRSGCEQVGLAANLLQYSPIQRSRRSWMIWEPVIVADPLDPVVVHVQPFKALRDEGKVEPLVIIC